MSELGALLQATPVLVQAIAELIEWFSDEETAGPPRLIRALPQELRARAVMVRERQRMAAELAARPTPRRPTGNDRVGR